MPSFRLAIGYQLGLMASAIGSSFELLHRDRLGLNTAGWWVSIVHIRIQDLCMVAERLVK